MCVARKNSPATIVINKINAIATKKLMHRPVTGADHEIQWILLELLNQMDSFDQGSNVKVGTLPHAQLSPTLIASVGDHGYYIVNARVLWMRASGCIELIHEIGKMINK